MQKAGTSMRGSVPILEISCLSLISDSGRGKTVRKSDQRPRLPFSRLLFAFHMRYCVDYTIGRSGSRSLPWVETAVTNKTHRKRLYVPSRHWPISP